MKVFIDSDVLIWHLRGEEKARSFLKALLEQEVDLWIGAMQRAEIVFFMRPEEERDTLDLLSLFKTHPVDQGVVDEAGKFYRKWSPSHGIDPNDAILAPLSRSAGGAP
jgi:predicted nucleic acid-binding protein